MSFIGRKLTVQYVWILFSNKKSIRKMLDRESGKQNTLMNEKQEQQHRAADEKEK